ncbi:MAG TPA: putative metalloprotease CJM1_0395 family protein [Gammaproteobacteria bacterium]|nr:putative metalloprotease CJM1_0395 family protein [Gammaproteobacteria bacterium]
MPTSPVRRVNDTPAQRTSANSNDSSNDNKTSEQEAAAIRREEQRLVQQLAARDREVRAHEAAHIAVGRQYVVSGPSYTYQQGPDGRSYAIGGEVQLDVAEEAEAQATLDKAETVRRAALAPVEPSAQDRQVAARASQLAAQARLSIAMERREEIQGDRRSAGSEQSGAAQAFSSSERPDDVALQVNEYV